MVVIEIKATCVAVGGTAKMSINDHRKDYRIKLLEGTPITMSLFIQHLPESGYLEIAHSVCAISKLLRYLSIPKMRCAIFKLRKFLNCAEHIHSMNTLEVQELM